MLCTTSDKQATDSKIYDGFTVVLLEIVLEMQRGTQTLVPSSGHASFL